MRLSGWEPVPLLVLEDGVVRRASLPDYVEAVRALVSLLPPGRVTTYKALAGVLGVSPRLVGRALALNPDPIVYPCHRVVRSDGSLGGYSLGAGFKRRLLELEGVRFDGERIARDSILGDPLADP
jgi:methylated-DNA-[protein]-cysteine S-methyltransferase